MKIENLFPLRIGRRNNKSLLMANGRLLIMCTSERECLWMCTVFNMLWHSHQIKLTIDAKSFDNELEKFEKNRDDFNCRFTLPTKVDILKFAENQNYILGRIESIVLGANYVLDFINQNTFYCED